MEDEKGMYPSFVTLGDLREFPPLQPTEIQGFTLV